MLFHFAKEDAMNGKNKKHEHSEPPIIEEALKATASVAQSTQEIGAEVYGYAGQAISDAYEKTAETVTHTYQQAKSYSKKHPRKTVAVAVGLGVGLGFIWGARARRLRSGRYAKPVVNALADIAMEFFR